MSQLDEIKEAISGLDESELESVADFIDSLFAGDDEDDEENDIEIDEDEEDEDDEEEEEESK